jgi:PLP dependent protein
MASGRGHRRQEQQWHSSEPGAEQLFEIVHSGGLASGLVDDHQTSPLRQPPQHREQSRPLARRHVAIEQKHAAARREPAQRGRQIAADPLVGNQPSLWHPGLAAIHPGTYSPLTMSSAEERRRQILDGIAAAAKVARREPGDVTLIAVTKTRSAEEIEELIAAGQRDFGESRVQEAQWKWPPLLDSHRHVRLHCIGRLQSNKAADAVVLFDSIHSLDRLPLLRALAKEADKTGRYPSVYIQVNIGDEPQKGGCAIGEIGALVAAVRESPLPLVGLMCIPPLGLEPSPFFALLAKLAAEHGVEGLSMGMSSDYRSAVMLGATAVRVGTALFD